MVVTVETDIGITGIGEGGSKDTLEQCAGTLIGKNPFKIAAIWQEAYIAWFYPPGREKTHGLGALDLALWDIKRKAFKLPVHELLGGTARDYCECYATSGGRPAGTPADVKLSLKERARATMEAGYRAFRMGAGDVLIGDVYDTRTAVRRIEQGCKDVGEGVGPDGTGALICTSASTLNDAVRCKAMEPYEPLVQVGFSGPVQLGS
jgi:galactonate dehydratase